MKTGISNFHPCSKLPNGVLNIKEKNIMPIVKVIKKGDAIVAALFLLFALKINLTINLKIKKARTPANTGEIIQESAISPILGQLITFPPPQIKPKPINAPTME